MAMQLGDAPVYPTVIASGDGTAREHLHRLHDVIDEGRVDVRITDMLVQQVPDGASELGRDLLRLEADVELRELHLSAKCCHTDEQHT